MTRQAGPKMRGKALDQVHGGQVAVVACIVPPPCQLWKLAVLRRGRFHPAIVEFWQRVSSPRKTRRTGSATAGQARRRTPTRSRRELAIPELAARVRLSAQENPGGAAQRRGSSSPPIVNLLALNSTRRDRRTAARTGHWKDALGSPRTRSDTRRDRASRFCRDSDTAAEIAIANDRDVCQNACPSRL